jgi:hypothetical protein
VESNTKPRRGTLRLLIEPLGESQLSWNDKLKTLRGQLTLLRMLVERDKPVSVESIRRAERLARSLESDPVELEL